MEGISSRQGGHQVAQKFTKTSWPRASASVNGLPSWRQPSKGAAGAGRAAGVTSKAFSRAAVAWRVSSAESCHRVQPAAAATKRATPAKTTGVPLRLGFVGCGAAPSMRRRS